MLVVIIIKLHGCPCMQILPYSIQRAKETIPTPLTLNFLAKFLLCPCMQNKPSKSGGIVLSILIPTHICQIKNHKASNWCDHPLHSPSHFLLPPSSLSHSRPSPSFSRFFSRNQPPPHFLHSSTKFPPSTQVNVTYHTMITYIPKSFE